MTLELYADCSRCEAICCVALAFDASAEFAVDKAAGEHCRHLTATNRCRIHSRLPDRGFSGCAKYDCYGAGQRATALVRQATFDDPSVRTRTLAETFARLVALGELLLLLREAGRLELGTERETERTRLQSELESLDTLERIACVDVERYERTVHQFLRGMESIAREHVRLRRMARVLPVR
jgi:hypothetical protein